MRYLFTLITLITVFTTSAMAANKSNLPTPQPTVLKPVNAIVAVVNDSVITQSELTASITQIKDNLSARKIPIPGKAELQQHALEQLIMKTLQLNLAKKNGVKVTDKALTQAISRIAKGRHLSVAQLEKKLQTEEHISQHLLRQQIKEQLLIRAVQQRAIANDIHISEAKVNQTWKKALKESERANQYNLSDILISLPDAPTKEQIENAKSRAEAILKKLKTGTRFSKIAKLESNEKNALNGGDMGWLTLDNIPDAFAEQLAHMKVNNIVGPIETGNGFHIIKLNGIRRNEDHPTKAGIKEQLFQTAYRTALEKWLKKIRSQAYIKIKLA